MRWLGLLVVLGGCDALFQLHHIDQPPLDGAPHDAMIADVVDARVDASIDAPPRTAGCPATYYVIGTQTTKYRIVNSLVSWQTAEATCVADRGNFEKYTHLVVFDDDIERSQVNALASGVTFWIGLDDIRVDYSYKWVSTENPQYPPLAAFQNGNPDKTVGADCGEMLGNSDLQMTGCSNLLRYICECDDFAEDPTHF